MKRVESVVVAFWAPRFERLRTTRTVHDLQNLVEATGRIPVGLTAQDMLEEAHLSLRKLEAEGVLRNVRPAGEGYYWGTKFKNVVFDFATPAIAPARGLLGRLGSMLSPSPTEAVAAPPLPVTPPTAPAALSITILRGELDQFELQSAFAYGGFSKIHRARQVRAVDDVVIKVADDKPYARARLAREIAFLKSTRNAHFVSLLDADPENTWFAMPEATGDLWRVRDLVIKNEQSIRMLIDRIGGAIQAVHDAGFVHRDLTPSNILLTDDGWVLADFGCVSRGRDDVPDEILTTGLGTAGWATPEAYRNARQATYVDDFYGLGRVLSWLASGVVPEHGMPSICPPGPFSGAIQRATSADPNERVSTFSEFRALIT